MDATGFVHPVKFETGGGRSEFHHGITRRELFAAMAMQGLLSRFDGYPERAVAINAIANADALIAEINQ